MTVVAPAAPLFGQSIRRNEDVRFLRGTARFIDDIDVPATTLHVAFVRSRYAHARIVEIDTMRALALPGVVRIFTAGDLASTLPTPGTYPNMNVTAAAHPVFANGVVRYAGQIIAAVVAESRALAEDGADQVDVIYDELPTVLDVREAASSAIRIHDHVPNNTYLHGTLGSGDVDRAFAGADVRVTRSFRIPRVAMVPMEARGAVAAYENGTGVLTVWCSAQDVHRPRTHLSYALGIPEHRVHIILPDVGGAFGQKQLLTSEVIATAHASIVLNRTVKWIEDRLENFASAPQGRGIDADLELALSADGRMLAIRGSVYGDLGAFTYALAPNATHTTATLLTNVYAIPAAAIRVFGLATNKAPTNPYRGAGRPEAAMMVEQLVDMAARALSMDPIELRRKNLVQPQQFPYGTALGLTYDSGDYERVLDRLIEMADLPALREARILARLEDRITGIGAAMYVERTGGSWESAAGSIEPDGRVIARTGSSPHGQGHETVFAQITADALSVSLDDVVLRWRDSNDVPRGVGTFASRSMTMGGNALYAALQNVRRKGSALAAFIFGVPDETLVWAGGMVHAPDGRSITLAALATASYDLARVPPGFELGLYCTGSFASAYAYTVGAQLAIVDVDRHTGSVTVRRIFAIDDAGRIVNPLLAEGQIIGATAQGLGEALFEEVRYDETGRQLSSSFLEYDVMTASVMPPVVASFVETPSPLNPLGIKGVGEGGCCGALAAVANAVSDALAPLGVAPLDVPFTEENVWRAIRAAALT